MRGRHWLVGLGVAAGLGLLLATSMPMASGDAPQGLPAWRSRVAAAERIEYLARGGLPSAFPYGAQWRAQWAATLLAARGSAAHPPMLRQRIALYANGVSETLAIGLRAAYERFVGRLGELTQHAGQSAEARYDIDIERARLAAVDDCGAVDRAALRGLWATVPWQGEDGLRKWERRYALSTEYAAKAAWAAARCALRAVAPGGDASVARTEVVVDRWLAPLAGDWPDVQRVRSWQDGSELLRVPAGTSALATRLLAMAKAGGEFQRVAGRGAEEQVWVGVLADVAWQAPADTPAPIALQPDLAAPAQVHRLLPTTVSGLAGLLRAVQASGAEVEAVFAF